MLIEKYFEQIDDCTQYADYGRQKYTTAKIINNAYITVLATGLYIKPMNMWHKNLSSDKKWAVFKSFFVEEYHDLCKMKCINTTQTGFHG